MVIDNEISKGGWMVTVFSLVDPSLKADEGIAESLPRPVERKRVKRGVVSQA